MKSIEILALGIRVVGIMFILQVLGFIGHGYALMETISHFGEDAGMAPWLVFYVVSWLVLSIICFVLIKYPLPVARRMLPRVDNDEPVFNGSIDDLAIAAFMVLGVYILTWAVPDFFHNLGIILRIYNEVTANLYNKGSLYDAVLRQAITVMEIGIGVYLCLQARGLNNLLRRLRGRA